MNKKHIALLQEMILYYRGDAKRIQHFLKVYEFASLIGRLENLPEDQQQLLETAAIVHDIGIKRSEEKYGSAAGKYQEAEGPAISREMLTRLGYAAPVIERVSYLIAHHHTYENIQEIDYQILVEADFLVNAYEDALSPAGIQAFAEKIFRTKSGQKLLQTIYNT